VLDLPRSALREVGWFHSVGLEPSGFVSADAGCVRGASAVAVYSYHYCYQALSRGIKNACSLGRIGRSSCSSRVASSREQAPDLAGFVLASVCSNFGYGTREADRARARVGALIRSAASTLYSWPPIFPDKGHRKSSGNNARSRGVVIA
jgi:hypothetical protein